MYGVNEHVLASVLTFCTCSMLDLEELDALPILAAHWLSLTCALLSLLVGLPAFILPFVLIRLAAHYSVMQLMITLDLLLLSIFLV